MSTLRHDVFINGTQTENAHGRESRSESRRKERGWQKGRYGEKRMRGPRGGSGRTSDDGIIAGPWCKNAAGVVKRIIARYNKSGFHRRYTCGAPSALRKTPRSQGGFIAGHVSFRRAFNHKSMWPFATSSATAERKSMREFGLKDTVSHHVVASGIVVMRVAKRICRQQT